MRVFFAIPLDEEIKNIIDRFNSENICPLFEDIKKVPKENLHITLKFIGEIGEDIVNAIHKKITQPILIHNTFTTYAQGLGVFPSPQKAKIMWIGLKNNIDKVTTIYNSISDILDDLKIEDDNEKNFHPHITINRFKKSPLPNKINSIIDKYKDKEFGTISVNSITLYQSILTPEKPIYTPIFTVKF